MKILRVLLGLALLAAQGGLVRGRATRAPGRPEYPGDPGIWATQRVAPTACPAAACAFLPLVASAAPVEISRLAHRQLRYRFVESRGAVANRGPRPVYGVTLEEKFYDAAGRLISSEARPAALPMLLPGRFTPFWLALPDVLLGEVARSEARITAWSWESDRTYLPVVVTVDRVDSWPLEMRLFGSVRNDQAVALVEVVCVAWWSEPGGEAYAGACASRLEPGETHPWEVHLFDDPVPQGVPVSGEGQGAADW